MAFKVSPVQSNKMQQDSQQFVETLAQAAQISPEKLRIQMGSRVVYGQTARGFRNELPQDRLKALFDGLQQPLTKGIDASKYARRQPEIEVKAGDEILFRQERDGNFTVNSFQLQQQVQQQTFIQVEQQPAQKVEVEQAPTPSLEAQVEPTASPTSQLEPTAGKTSIAPEASLSQSQPQAEVTQPQAEVAEHSPQQIKREPSLLVPDDASRSQTASEIAQSEFGAAAVAYKQAEKLPPGQTQQFVKVLTQELGKRSVQAIVAIASLPQWKRERDVANTALQLFHHNYRQTGEQLYHAENYTVKLQGLDNYTLSDRKGQELMRFKAGGLTGPKILENRMNKLQYQDFNQARSQIQKLGGANGISQDPQQRLSQLGNLAPKGDRELVYATKIKQVVQTARDYLRSMGVSTLRAGQQGNYSMDAKGNDYLRIEEHASGRGTVLEIENGTLKSNLGAKDFSHFRQLQNSMHLQASTTDSQQTVVKTPATDIFLDNSQLRNLAAVITAQNVLDSLGTNTYESDKYRFERLGDAITLAAKDGRGEIARMEPGRITGQLSSQDAMFLNQMNRAVIPQSEKSSDLGVATAQTQARITLWEQAAQNGSKTRAKELELGE